MSAVKTWNVCYSVRYINQTVKEHQVEVEARSLLEAYRIVAANYAGPELKQPDVDKVVIWDVAIVNQDVF